MAELSKVNRCYHCGVVLQSEDKTKPGYIEKNIVDKYPNGLLLCDDCFKNERYNSAPQEADFEEDYEKILNEIKSKKALVVYVVDLFSFEGSFISKVNKMLKETDVIAVANKRDLLPDDYDNNWLLEYVEHRLRVSKLNVKKAILVSSNTGYNIDYLIKELSSYAKDRDIYVVGASTSGKSRLIEELLKQYVNETRSYITTITFKGTKLRGFKIPLNKNHAIYETPGLGIDNSLVAKVERTVQNAIVPTKMITERKVVLGKNNVLALGGLVAIQLLSDKKCELRVFASEKVNLLTSKSSPEKFMAEIYKRHKISPISSNLTGFADFDAYDFKITEEGERDIGILGLGWFSFLGDEQLFRVYVPKGIYVYTTRSKIKKNVK